VLLSNLSAILVCLCDNLNFYDTGHLSKQWWVNRLIAVIRSRRNVSSGLSKLFLAMEPELEKLVAPKVVWLMQAPINRTGVTTLLRRLMVNLPKELSRDARVFSKL
jgi:hypothetical protein